MTVYFDHNATTPVHPAVLEAMLPHFSEQYGNASCLYKLGVDASYALEKARLETARLIGARAEEIVFTSGGTESDNLALRGIVLATGRKHVITSAIEHPAVLRTCQYLEKHLGCRVDYLPADGDGRIDPYSIEALLTDETCVISVMTANNETGAIQPLREIADLAKRKNVFFHTDAVQAAGRLPLDVNRLGADLVSLSAHKFYGPKGVGALFVRKSVNLVPLLQGGGHESGLRAGTENIAGIAGMGMAAKLARKELESRVERLNRLGARLWERLEAAPFAIRRNTPQDDALPGVLNFSVEGADGRELVRALDEKGFCVSAGSACSSGRTEPSTVLRAMGLSEEEANAAIRVSLGRANTEEEIDAFAGALAAVTQAV
ncbi:MAG: aminotransferase class V-fold PLP-dependent enzyme [bacterium]|nr:aminotransferase class V-fold PLP-dependent enzyme [bacterium]